MLREGARNVISPQICQSVNILKKLILFDFILYNLFLVFPTFKIDYKRKLKKNWHSAFLFHTLLSISQTLAFDLFFSYMIIQETLFEYPQRPMT